MHSPLQFAHAASQMDAVETLGTVEEPKKKVWSTFSDVRYGPITMQSEVLNAVFTDSNHQVLYAETGGALFNILGISVGAGLIRENGFLLGADGTASTQEDRLSVIPFKQVVFSDWMFLMTRFWFLLQRVGSITGCGKKSGPMERLKNKYLAVKWGTITPLVDRFCSIVLMRLRHLCLK